MNGHRRWWYCPTCGRRWRGREPRKDRAKRCVRCSRPLPREGEEYRLQPPFLYVIDIDPTRRPAFVKVGLAVDMDDRVADVQNWAPALRVVRYYEPRSGSAASRSYAKFRRRLDIEQAAIRCLAKRYPRLGNEVFEVPREEFSTALSAIDRLMGGV